MIIKDISFPDSLENILYDEVLLHLAEQENSDDTLRFWESSEPCVVLGKISDPAKDLVLDDICRDNIKVFRRVSGGGTVLLGEGCLNYSLILSKARNPQLHNINQSYQSILGKITEAFKAFGVECEYFPICDMVLSAGSKKFSGNAQKRSRNYILHHGTILYDFDISLMPSYLKIPEDQPQYRQNRGHLDFVANLPLSREKIKKAISGAFAAQENSGLNRNETDLLQHLAKTREVTVSFDDLLTVNA